MLVITHNDVTPVIGKKTTYKTFSTAVEKAAERGIPSMVVMTKMDGIQVIRLPQPKELPLKTGKGTVVTSIMTRQGKAIPNRPLSDYLERIMPPGSVGELVLNGEVSQAAGLIADEGMDDPISTRWKVWLFNNLGNDTFHRRMLKLAGKVDPTNIQRIEIIPMTVRTIPKSEEEFNEILMTEFAERKAAFKPAKVEGLIYTHTLAPYVAGPPGKVNHHAGKYVPLKTEEFKLVGMDEAAYGKDLKTVPEHLWGKPKGWMGSLRLEHPKEGSKPFGVGTGFSLEERKWFWENKDLLIIEDNPLYVEIAFLEFGSQGAPRTPRFRSLRNAPSGDNIPTMGIYTPMPE